MTQDKIKQIIEDYEQLESHAEGVLRKMGKLWEIKYNPKDILRLKCKYDNKGIEKIDFTGIDYVLVTCYATHMCEIDYDYLSFPISYLSMSDEELSIAVEKEKKEEEQEILKKELDEAKKEEQKEKERYEKLKLKFGNKI